MPTKLAVATFIAGVAFASLAAAQTKVTLVQAHANIAMGEEIFLYAVPQKFGWFKEEGLEVSVVGAAGGVAAAQVLQSGGAQFATTAAEVVMQMREQGGDPVAVFNVKRRGGWAIGLLPDSPIKQLADLKGKTVGVAALGSGVVPLLRQSLAGLGMKDADYTLVAAGTGAQAASAIQTKRVDGLALWESMYAAMENVGVKMNYVELPIVERLAGFSLASTDRFVKANPKAVAGYCRAVAKGFLYTVSNLPAAIRIFYEVFPQTKPANIDEAESIRRDTHIMNAWLANAKPRPGAKIGTSYLDMWEFTRDYYTKSGMLKSPKPIDESVTNRFIDECNRFDAAAIEKQAKVAR